MEQSDGRQKGEAIMGSTRLKARYAVLAARLRNLGLLVQGTITKRVIPGLGGKSYGPYYQWTRKLNAKTVTVNLSRFQVKEFQTAIDNNRKLEETIQEMRKISLKICEATTVGVKKRKP